LGDYGLMKGPVRQSNTSSASVTGALCGASRDEGFHVGGEIVEELT